MKPINKVWRNGQISTLAKTKFDFNQALNYGAAVFEGMRFYETDNGPAIFRLDEHLNRFMYSASNLGMRLKFNKDNLKKAIIDLVKLSKLTSGYIRPVAYYDQFKAGANTLNTQVDMLIFVWPWDDHKKQAAVKLKIAKDLRIDAKRVDFKSKITGYYANGIVGFLEVQKHDYDLPLFLDKNGYITESTISNIFIFKKNILYTPKLGNVLSGVTRDSIISIAKDTGFKVVAKSLKPEFIEDADEVFITGDGMELLPVMKVDKYFDNVALVWPKTTKLQDAYYQMVHTSESKYSGWLTQL